MFNTFVCELPVADIKIFFILFDWISLKCSTRKPILDPNYHGEYSPTISRINKRVLFISSSGKAYCLSLLYQVQPC